MQRTLPKSKTLADENPFSLSLGDLMAGLLLIFVLLLSFLMLNLTEVVATYKTLREDLYLDLKTEFEKDLEKWQAILDREKLSVRFRKPEVLFKKGSADVLPVFKEILDDFFPRYIELLTETKDANGKAKYINHIAEIRIEGHTSSEWSAEASQEEAYILNMELSQDRTRRVLHYVIQIPEISEKKGWLKQYLTANGLSSSKLITLITLSSGNESQGESRHRATTTWGTIKTQAAKEIPEESRRVEFRVWTNAVAQLDKLSEGKREFR